jgi:hypothetical protein
MVMDQMFMPHTESFLDKIAPSAHLHFFLFKEMITYETFYLERSKELELILLFLFPFYHSRRSCMVVYLRFWSLLSCARPINVVCWKRAVCLEFMEKVRLLWSLIHVGVLDISKVTLLVIIIPCSSGMSYETRTMPDLMPPHLSSSPCCFSVVYSPRIMPAAK